MKEVTSIIRSDKTIAIGFSLSLVFSIFAAGYITLFYQSLPPFIPLYNQMPWGDERLGLKEHIFIPLFLAFGMAALNFLISLTIYGKIPLVSRIIAITSFLLCFLMVFIVIRTIYLIE